MRFHTRPRSVREASARRDALNRGLIRPARTMEHDRLNREYRQAVMKVRAAVRKTAEWRTAWRKKNLEVMHRLERKAGIR